jgi:hypothetical protein
MVPKPPTATNCERAVDQLIALRDWTLPEVRAVQAAPVGEV